MIVNIDEEPLILPEKNYGPICSKIFAFFREHFSLPEDMLVPEPGLKMHLSLSRIVDMMVSAMGPEIRSNIVKELEDYKANQDEIQESYVADVKFTHVNRSMLGSSPVRTAYLTEVSQSVSDNQNQDVYQKDPSQSEQPLQ